MFSKIIFSIFLTLVSFHSVKAEKYDDLENTFNGHFVCNIDKISIDRFDKKKLRSYGGFEYGPKVGDEIVLAFRFNRNRNEFSFISAEIGQELGILFPWFSFDLNGKTTIILEPGKFSGPYNPAKNREPLIAVEEEYESNDNRQSGNLSYDSIYFNDGINQTAHFQRISSKGWVGVVKYTSDPLLHLEPLTNIAAYLNCFYDDNPRVYFEEWNTVIDVMAEHASSNK